MTNTELYFIQQEEEKARIKGIELGLSKDELFDYIYCSCSHLYPMQNTELIKENTKSDVYGNL